MFLFLRLLGLCCSIAAAVVVGAPGASDFGGEGGVERREEPAPDAEVARRHAALSQEIARHDRLYFREAAPEISDADYDALRRELTEIEGRFPHLASSAASAAEASDDRTGFFPTYRHRELMGSLAKARNEAEVRQFHERLAARLGREAIGYVVEPKIDGLAISVTYENGKLVRAVTRGNGIEGDEITANVVLLTGLPRALNAVDAAGIATRIPQRIELRGEIYLTWREFHRINREREAAGLPVFAHPRNLAAGTVRQRTLGEMAERSLEIAFFGFAACEPEEVAPLTQRDLHRRLQAWGLPAVPEKWLAQNANELWAAVQAIGRAREDFGFPMDGAVMKVDSVAAQREAGVAGNLPRWALAYKFAAERVETRLLAITLQVGRSGVLTPVAEFAPVRIGGSTVARATLHNAAEIARKDVRVGDVVVIEKTGDVVPTLAGVVLEKRADALPPYVFPRRCPSCGEAVVQRAGEAAIRCPASECPAQVRRRLEHFASADGVGIDGLGTATIELLVSRGLVRTPADLYRLRREDLLTLGRNVERSTDRLLTAIDSSRRAELWRFVHGLGIPQVGATTARSLAQHFGSLEALAAARPEDFEAVDRPPLRGVGGATVRSVGEFFAEERNRNLVRELVERGVRPALPAVTATSLLAGKVFALTGTLPTLSRAEATAKIEAAGGRVSSSVSGRTDFVVAGAEAGAKLEQARANQVPVIDEDELMRMLNGIHHAR